MKTSGQEAPGARSVAVEGGRLDEDIRDMRYEQSSSQNITLLLIIGSHTKFYNYFISKTRSPMWKSVMRAKI